MPMGKPGWNGWLGLLLLLWLPATIAAPSHAATAAFTGGQDHPEKMQWSEMQRRFKGAFVLSASRDVRKVALTFDDVPDPRFTPRLLDILKQKQTPATFFVVGSRADKHPALVRRIHREGHAIGNHSYSHPDFSRLSLGEMKSQIKRTERSIEAVLGFAPRLIRPPYGEILPRQLAWAKESGYTVVNWDVDSADWRQLDADQVYHNVIRAVRPGSVILLHAGGGTGQSLAGTIEALPRVIDWLRSNGYELVTLPALLDMPEVRHMPVQQGGQMTDIPSLRKGQ